MTGFLCASRGAGIAGLAPADSALACAGMLLQTSASRSPPRQRLSARCWLCASCAAGARAPAGRACGEQAHVHRPGVLCERHASVANAHRFYSWNTLPATATSRTTHVKAPAIALALRHRSACTHVNRSTGKPHTIPCLVRYARRAQRTAPVLRAAQDCLVRSYRTPGHFVVLFNKPLEAAPPRTSCAGDARLRWASEMHSAGLAREDAPHVEQHRPRQT